MANRNLGSASHLAQFPPELQNIIDHSQWSDIVTELRAAESDAMLLSCCGEWCCCLCTGFFCIFCFHPMINDSIAKSNLEKACRDINARYFRGSPTFYVDSALCIFLGVNTLSQFQSYSTPYPVETAYSQQEYDGKPVVVNPVYTSNQNTPVMATAEPVPNTTQQAQPQQQQTTRHAQFTVPEGVAPGTTVNTISPAGNPVSIVIPNDAAPGSVVTYSY